MHTLILKVIASRAGEEGGRGVLLGEGIASLLRGADGWRSRGSRDGEERDEEVFEVHDGEKVKFKREWFLQQGECWMMGKRVPSA